MQEHIRRAHPEHYISKLPATEESFLLMVNSPPSQRPQTQQSSPPGGPGQVPTPNSQGMCSPIPGLVFILLPLCVPGGLAVAMRAPLGCRVNRNAIIMQLSEMAANILVAITNQLILISPSDRHFYAASRQCCSGPGSAPQDRPRLGL